MATDAEYNAVLADKELFEKRWNDTVGKLEESNRLVGELQKIIAEAREAARGAADLDILDILAQAEKREEISNMNKEKQIEGSCSSCGRVENANRDGSGGHWFAPCPSDDCPSNCGGK